MVPLFSFLVKSISDPSILSWPREKLILAKSRSLNPFPYEALKSVYQSISNQW